MWIVDCGLGTGTGLEGGFNHEEHPIEDLERIESWQWQPNRLQPWVQVAARLAQRVVMNLRVQIEAEKLG